jgi:hypothetical protein
VPSLFSERQPPFTCSSLTVVNVGGCLRARAPAGMLAATSSFAIRWTAANATPGIRIASATAATA